MANFLTCTYCGKCVSTAFEPEPTDTPDKGLIIRACIICPECIEAGRITIPDETPKTPSEIALDWKLRGF